MSYYRRPLNKLGFVPGQQPELQQYITAAWKTYCQQESLDPKARCSGRRCFQCDYCTWYESVLVGATGKKTSTECNAGRHYDFLMRDLEIIHGLSTKWQMKAAKGDAVRIIYELRKRVAEHDIQEDYLRAVARNMLQLDELPALEQLKAEQLIIILGEVKRFIDRKLKRDRLGATAVAAGDPDWFV